MVCAEASGRRFCRDVCSVADAALELAQAISRLGRDGEVALSESADAAVEKDRSSAAARAGRYHGRRYGEYGGRVLSSQWPPEWTRGSCSHRAYSGCGSAGYFSGVEAEESSSCRARFSAWASQGCDRQGCAMDGSAASAD